MIILNLTQHAATKDQKEGGVIDPPSEIQGQIREALTFEVLPDIYVVRARADYIDYLAREWRDSLHSPAPVAGVMIGGPPYLMGPLEKILVGSGFRVLFAFSVRARHAGFVEGDLSSREILFEEEEDSYPPCECEFCRGEC